MRLELLRGATGMCITLDGTRITDPKIYGTMTPIQVWSVDADSIAEIIECERVRRGRWIEVQDSWGICSNCKTNVSICWWANDTNRGQRNYCPKCGAYMSNRRG